MEIVSQIAPAEPPGFKPEAAMVSDGDKIEDFRVRIANTNIDPGTFLSTDYFNTFNSVIMVLDMLPEAPELLEEMEQWEFVDYTRHFQESGLDFSALAIEGYSLAPKDALEALRHKVWGIRIIIENSTRMLKRLLDIGEQTAVSNIAASTALQLRAMIAEGNGIVHGNTTIGQADIDKLF
ncbi:MAG: hypothetical protein PHE27_03915 [Alphaproteobacteria bacterium]|nr:hypothetical protein [Alphaproteobacteria bacterium]